MTTRPADELLTTTPAVCLLTSHLRAVSALPPSSEVFPAACVYEENNEHPHERKANATDFRRVWKELACLVNIVFSVRFFVFRGDAGRLLLSDDCCHSNKRLIAENAYFTANSNTLTVCGVLRVTLKFRQDLGLELITVIVI